MSFQLIAGMAGIVSILTALAGLIKKMDAQRRDFAETKELARKNDETGKLLLKCNLAILDGLKQQGCNGRVTEMREKLVNFAVEK